MYWERPPRNKRGGDGATQVKERQTLMRRRQTQARWPASRWASCSWTWSQNCCLVLTPSGTSAESACAISTKGREVGTMQDLPPKSGTISHSSLLTCHHPVFQRRDILPACVNGSLLRYRQGQHGSLLMIRSLAVEPGTFRCRASRASYSFPTKSFADVPITDAGVDTLAFLEASEGLLGLFGASVLRILGVITPIDVIQSLPLPTRRSVGFRRLRARAD